MRIGRVGPSGSASGGRDWPTGIQNPEEVEFSLPVDEMWFREDDTNIHCLALDTKYHCRNCVTEQGTFLSKARRLKREATGNPQVVGRLWRERSSEKQCYIKLFMNF